ncbi:MAG: hypothetical protein ISQ46_03865 [Methylophilaceae bacterium]|nr:hypothetical protein [Methylophilaceae bacterium]
MYKIFSEMTKSSDTDSDLKFYNYNQEDICAVWEKKREGIWRGNILLMNQTSKKPQNKKCKHSINDNNLEEEQNEIADVYATQEHYCVVC